MSNEHESPPEPTVEIGGLRGPDEKFHPIQYDLESELTDRNPDEEYRIFAIKYTDDAEKEADGALFEIDPNGKTPIMHIIKEGYTASRQVVEGDGTVLSVLPSGDIKEFKVGGVTAEPLNQGEGWIDCWIAGPDGMKVIDRSQPAFQLDFEHSVPVDDPSLPAEYWERYHGLTDLPQTS